MGKPRRKPSAPQAQWDMGPAVLAVLGDVPEMVAKFRLHLVTNKIARDAVMAEPQPGESTRQAEKRRAKARAVTADWMARNGYRIHSEEATWTDEKGNRVNPNGVKRARRIDLIEHYHRKGTIDARGLNAAMKLRVAFEATQRSPPAVKEVDVDTSPKPDQNIAILMDRISAYSRIMGMVPRGYREIIDCVVVRNRTPADLPQYRGRRFREGVSLMADGVAALADVMEREGR